MTVALSEFKLNEVPEICLSIDLSVAEIFRVIHPEVYIEDILEPSVVTLETLMAKYFAQSFKRKIIVVDKVKIKLECPRNMLNILLFLNEFFNLPIEKVFLIYLVKMVKEDQIKVVEAIKTSNIPSLCQVDNEVFEEAAEKVLSELL